MDYYSDNTQNPAEERKKTMEVKSGVKINKKNISLN